jgi:alpha-D-ribose 1-methylphosphonate 5-triphosphate diphosphatase
VRAGVLGNARLVLRDEVRLGTVAFEDGRIRAVDCGRTSVPAAGDLEGDYLLPGLVELHTDNFEHHLMPRPKVRWPEMPALLGHDAEVAAAGITTVFDALGVGDCDPEAMRAQDMSTVLDAIRDASVSGSLRADHRLHVRAELPAPNALDRFDPFRDDPLLGLISLMDHTPGQRQWENLEQARIYYTGRKGWSNERFERQVSESKEMQDRYAVPHRRHFVSFAAEHGIPIASHDDTRVQHVEQATSEGVTIAEFPTTLAAARSARANGLSIVMGAPNVVRGGSHSGNIAAVDLARVDLLDTLSSDYIPASLLMAVFQIAEEAGWGLPRAVASVSRNPARSVGLDDRGEILEGQRADLVQVRVVGGQPVVRAVWRQGQRVV